MLERLDVYSALGLSRGCSEEEVRRSYRKLALKTHPDKEKGTESEFLAIGFSYRVLSDRKLRALYDRRDMDFSASKADLIESFDINEALAIFDHFFGTSNPFAAVSEGVESLFDSEADKRKPKPSQRIEIELPCTLEEIYNSISKNIEVPKQRVNSDGQVENYTKTYRIQAEPSWISGTKLKFDKEPDDLTGDVIFTVQIEPHAVFEIENFSLKMKQEVSLCDSLTGFVIPIQMPDGRKLNVAIEEVIDPSFCKIIKGEGLLDKERNIRGDLIITFHIHFPKKLLPIQRDLLQLALRLPQELTNANNIQVIQDK
mmetsp:Transcript_34577/g.77978  ORF Transcript_34577/g.77978 Transcript_34577/m.77978 type:complete len:314 (-) Transcript_34577:275-1216(-)